MICYLLLLAGRSLPIPPVILQGCPAVGTDESRRRRLLLDTPAPSRRGPG